MAVRALDQVLKTYFLVTTQKIANFPKMGLEFLSEPQFRFQSSRDIFFADNAKNCLFSKNGLRSAVRALVQILDILFADNEKNCLLSKNGPRKSVGFLVQVLETYIFLTSQKIHHFCENGLVIAVRALVLVLETYFLLTTQKLATFHKKKCCQSLRLGSRDIFFIPPKKFEKYFEVKFNVKKFEKILDSDSI